MSFNLGANSKIVSPLSKLGSLCSDDISSTSTHKDVSMILNHSIFSVEGKPWRGDESFEIKKLLASIKEK